MHHNIPTTLPFILYTYVGVRRSVGKARSFIFERSRKVAKASMMEVFMSHCGRSEQGIYEMASRPKPCSDHRA